MGTHAFVQLLLQMDQRGVVRRDGAVPKLAPGGRMDSASPRSMRTHSDTVHHFS